MKLNPKIHDTRNRLDYVLTDNYYLPALRLPEETRPIGRWGRLHKKYLKTYRPVLYQSLLLSGKLCTILADLDEQAAERCSLIVQQMAEAEGSTEKVKASDPVVPKSERYRKAMKICERLMNQRILLLKQTSSAAPNPASLEAVGATFVDERMEEVLLCAISLVLLMGSLAAPAFAYGAEPAPKLVEIESLVTVLDENPGPLTPEGNLTLVDDYHTTHSDDSGQQFITLVSKSGAYFYLVVDWAPMGTRPSTL